MNKNLIVSLIDRVRENSPLIHNITNVVVTNFTANGLLALGVSPVMAYEKREVADMARIASALVLNIGTLRQEEVEAMILAGKAANEKGIPVIFDPVGLGATPYRAEATEQILSEVKVTLIRGNAGEISQLAGAEGEVKGVDAGDVSGDIGAMVKAVAQKYGSVVIATGEVDYISDGERTYKVHNGDPLLTKVTGSGCLLSSVVGAFAAVEEDYTTAALAALTFYGVAAEVATKKVGSQGPGSFQVEFLNQLHLVGKEEVSQYATFEEA